jgi:hypothetical protein
VTLDESWFYWDIDWEQQWLPADDESGTRRRRGIDREKTTLTVIWNMQRFYLIDGMPRGEKFSAPYFIDKILTPICAQLIPTGRRKLVIHADNSRCHNAKVVLDFMSQNQAKCVPRPPYSPDLAPFDLFFWLSKRRTPKLLFQTSEELLNAMRGLLHDISPQMLRDIFHEWINRCEQVIATEEDYFE